MVYPKVTVAANYAYTSETLTLNQSVQHTQRRPTILEEERQTMSVSSLLYKLKTESKKNVTKFSKITDIEYRSESIELFGETYVIKRVALVNHSEYKVGWVLDNQTKGCMRCNCEFNLMVWRHHCRSCGFVICSSCGDKKINFNVFEEESPAGSRVCRFCYDSTMPTGKKNRKKGPPTLVSQTPVVEEVDISVNTSTTLVDNSINLNETFENESTDILEVRKEVSVAAVVLQKPETKSYAPKLRPTLAAIPELSDAPGPAPVITQATAAPTLGAPQQGLCPAPMPVRKNRDVPTLTPSITASLREEELTMSSLNSSAISTGTKTIINTAYNATLVAPPPKRGQTNTAPEIFSPVQTIPALDMGMETPPSCGSIGSGEVQVNLDRFGSPTRQKLIMEDARSNAIWEAADDDGTSTCSSAAPTPSSAISGTTNGGAGVGYIRSPWDANSFSPFGSQQKPRRLMANTGGSSVGRSGGRSISKSGGVKFAVDCSFSADAMADIATQGKEDEENDGCDGADCENSLSLPLTREQLQQLQQQQYAPGVVTAGASSTRAVLRDVENVNKQQVPPVNTKVVQKNVAKATKAAVPVCNSEENQAPVPLQHRQAVQRKETTASLPPLSKAGNSRATKAVPR